MWCLLLSGVALQTLPWAHGAEPSVAKESTSNPAPTTITSRTMTVSNQANSAIVDGAVVLTRGPVSYTHLDVYKRQVRGQRAQDPLG